MLLDSVCLPQIKNYADAVRIYEEIVPYRSGSKRGEKPLGANRRYKECTIENDNGVIKAMFFDKPILSFCSDGSVHVRLHYDSASTRQFIRGASVFDTKVIRGDTYLVAPTGKDYVFKDPRETTLIFNKDFECVNAPLEYRYVLDRAKFKQEKERYRGFIEYVDNMSRITTFISEDEVRKATEKSVWYQDGLGHKQMRRITLPRPNHLRYSKDSIEEVLRASLKNWEHKSEQGDLEYFYTEFIRLLVSACRYDYMKRGYGDEELTRKKMLDFIDEMIKFNAPESVFVREEVETGKAINNANRKYFKK